MVVNKQKTNPPGRPSKTGGIIKGGGRVKTFATGETRNSPFTQPNIIWWIGLSLIFVSGWSTGRIQTVFKLAWNPTNFQSDIGNFLSALKSTGLQLLFLFILVVSARAIPPLAKIWLILLLGLWIMWLINNPQLVQTLASAANNVNNTSSNPANNVSKIAASLINKNA